MNGSRPRGPNSEWEDKAMRKCSVLLAALPLSACGSRTPLTPPEGQSLPPKPLAATETPPPPELMAPSAQARPGRNDELPQHSAHRPPDEYAPPPPPNTTPNHIPT